MNKKQKSLTNKGFSLVELIIVIAIMAVLVGVLAPQFIKYVEQSRRSTDIQNAENIKTAVLADIADGQIEGSSTTGVAFVDYSASSPKKDGSMATTIATAPKVSGNKVNHGGSFYVTYNATTGTCSVYPDAGLSYDLTNADTAVNYKTAK